MDEEDKGIWGCALIPPIVFGGIVVGIVLLASTDLIEAVALWVMPLFALSLTWVGLLFSYKARDEAISAKLASESAKQATNQIMQGVTMHQTVVPMLGKACDDMKNLVEIINTEGAPNELIDSIGFELSDLVAELRSMGKLDISDSIDKIREEISHDMDVKKAKDFHHKLNLARKSVQRDTTAFGLDSVTSTSKTEA